MTFKIKQINADIMHCSFNIKCNPKSGHLTNKPITVILDILVRAMALQDVEVFNLGKKHNNCTSKIQ